jgi:CheY-like chemotaxis protein
MEARGISRGMKKRVLVVEDYEDTRILLKFMIEQLGYSVIEASGPYEAIDKAAEFLPDLILMDIGMPLLDGLSVAQLIHDKKTNSLVPIIAVTAFSDIKAEALKAGCSDVIYKPVQPELLREMLDRYAGHA